MASSAQPQLAVVEKKDHGNPIESWQRSEQTDQLFAAMVKAQMGFKPVVRDKVNFSTSTPSLYADLPNLIKATRPALAKNGLLVLQFPRADLANRKVAIKTAVIHSSGQWMSNELEIQVTPHSEGETLETLEPSSVAWAITFCRRQAYQSVTGVAAEDDPGADTAAAAKKKIERVHQLGKKKVSQTNAQTFWRIAKEHGKTADQVATYLQTKFNITRTEDMLDRDFADALAWAKEDKF